MSRAAPHQFDQHWRGFHHDIAPTQGTARNCSTRGSARVQHRFDGADAHLHLGRLPAHLALDLALRLNSWPACLRNRWPANVQAELLVAPVQQPRSCSSAAIRADIADWVMKSFSAARDTDWSVATQ